MQYHRRVFGDEHEQTLHVVRVAMFCDRSLSSQESANAAKESAARSAAAIGAVRGDEVAAMESSTASRMAGVYLYTVKYYRNPVACTS